MPHAIVVGGSVAGLASAVALHGVGYSVDVIERSTPPPDDWTQWHRPTVPQAQHSHTLTSLGVRVLRDRLPEVLDRLLAAGARLLDMTTAMPDARPCDDLVALACRRSTFEMTFYHHVRSLPGVHIRHSIVVDGVVLDGARVRGVVADELIAGDVVVDATGRRAAARDWLAAAGVTLAPDAVSPSGLAGFTRFYRLLGASAPGPLNRGNAAGGIWDDYAGVLHPGDAGTFAVALGVLPGDTRFGSLRETAAFTELAGTSTGLAPWLAAGEPISAVHPITCPPDTLRAAAVASPVAGLYPVGDAACVTNPLFGRGMSLALSHAYQLADLLAARPDDDPVPAGRLADRLYRPWYEHAAAADRDRIARWGGATPANSVLRNLAAAAPTDPVVWRAVTRMLMSLTTPAELVDDDALVRRLAPVAEGV